MVGKMVFGERNLETQKGRITAYDGVLHSHEEAKDAVQISSILAFCKLPSFKHEGAFRSWLVRILVNEAVSILRQRKNRLQKFSKPSSSTEVGETIERLPSPRPTPNKLS